MIERRPQICGKIEGLRTWLQPSAQTISTNCFWEQSMAKRYYDKNSLPIYPLSTHHRFINLTGRRFGRLTVLSFAGSHPDRKWFCECDCGSVVRVRGYCLVGGETKSCGCLHRERRRTHGSSRTPLYKIWQGIKDRCQNPQNTRYAYYGGRGIAVCDRWQNFANFAADIGPRPSDAHSVERLKNDGNYCPENCVWATREQQLNNMRGNRLMVLDGEKKTMAEWCGGSKTPHYFRTRSRVQLGWCDKCALTNPRGVVCPHMGDAQ
jgi:hypothetical protein